MRWCVCLGFSKKKTLTKTPDLYYKYVLYFCQQRPSKKLCQQKTNPSGLNRKEPCAYAFVRKYVRVYCAYAHSVCIVRTERTKYAQCAYCSMCVLFLFKQTLQKICFFQTQNQTKILVKLCESHFFWLLLPLFPKGKISSSCALFHFTLRLCGSWTPPEEKRYSWAPLRKCATVGPSSWKCAAYGPDPLPRGNVLQWDPPSPYQVCFWYNVIHAKQLY